ncbi:MAG: hypothetical protein FK733_19205 [Asgard group archaeon]|nr:hypothetical protein [Asgard group archaeon]
MAENDGMAFLNKKNLTAKFQEFIDKIATYLEKPMKKIKFCVSIQEKNSPIEIADIGRKFGVVYNEKGQLILANWLIELPVKEREHLINYLLIRESFRVYFNEEIKTHPYERFTEIILHVMALLIICEEQKVVPHERSTLYVRRRAEGYEDEDILKTQYWIYFMENCYKYNLTAKKLFPVFIQRVKDAIEEDRSINDLAWDVMYWLKAHLPEEISYALPICIEKKRHYDLLKELSVTPYKKSSALALSEKIGRSHRVISRDFKQIIDEYKVNWYVDIDLLKLRLYPYFYRINLRKSEYKDQIIKKLRNFQYTRVIRECDSQEVILLVGWIESPQVVYRHLSEYLEKLQKDDLIEDYYIGQIRRRRITWTISTEELEPTKETYQILIDNPEKYNCYTITALDTKYDITKHKKIKKEHFNEDVLLFLSTILLHNLGHTNYFCKPIELIYELCDKKGIDKANSLEVLDFINQMDIRCKRLGLMDYYLFFRELDTFKKALYFELKGKPDEINSVVEKLEVTGEMRSLSFLDRMIIYFPEVKYGSVFHGIVEELLRNNNISFHAYQINYHRGLRMPKFNYLEAYDHKTDQWITK